MKKFWIAIILIILSIIFYGCIDDDENLEDKDDNDDDVVEAQLTITAVNEIIIEEKDKIIVTSNIHNDTFTFTSSNNKYLIIDEFGYFEALYPGTVIITISSQSGVVATHTIIVKNKPRISSIKVYVDHEGIFYTDQIYHITWEFFPANADPFVYFEYDNNAINFNQSTGEISFIYGGTYTFFCKGSSQVYDTIVFDVEFPEDKFVYNLLFLGNSFTKCGYYDIPDIIRLMIKADGDLALIYVNAPGGYYLYQHEEYLIKKLQQTQFMYVFLQEQSRGTIDYYSSFESSVTKYNDIIRSYGAEPILYQTWVYNLAHFNGNKTSQDEMHTTVQSAYTQVSGLTGMRISKAGNAFYDCLTNYPSINLFVDNNGHASKYGAYLSACVHYYTITGKSPLDNEYNPSGIDETTKVILQTIAEKICLEN